MLPWSTARLIIVAQRIVRVNSALIRAGSVGKSSRACYDDVQGTMSTVMRSARAFAGKG
jgi:hypothetical protein